MIQYALGSSGQHLVFSAGVVAHLERHRQLRFWQREAGGLLFARLLPGRISIEHATGPRGADRRTRWSYHPDRAAEQREIDAMHPEGLHFVGTWHTHPEPVPTPSRIDIESLLESFKLSTHGLNAFVLAIIGQCAAPAGLTVTVGDATSVVRLVPDLAASPALMEI
jgi:integrative and conjugative element protein (TIGR02256 family)